MIRLCLITALLTMLLSGCASIHARDVKDASEDRLGVGLAQRELHNGMSGAEVIAVLGSPNIVTTDDKRREVWVYDRVSTDSIVSQSGGGLFGLFGGLQGNELDYLKGGSGGIGAGVASTTQKTMTVIVKFDQNNKVRDFAYQTTRF